MKYSFLKNILFLPVFLLMLVNAQGQSAIKHEPDPVIDASKELKAKSYYSGQKRLWSELLNESKKDPVAWYNLYKAVRFESYTATSKDIGLLKQKELDELVEEMGEAVSSSFEYNYVKYWNGGHNANLFQYLEKAYRADPKRTDIYDDLIAHYEMQGQPEKKKEFCAKWKTSGEIGQGVYEYNYNVLASVEKGGILFTNGEYDTYPAWILQESEGTRKDISILNIDLLMDDAYMEKKFSELGLAKPENALLKRDKAGFFEALTKLNPGKPLYFGLTVSPEYTKSIRGKLYFTGLAVKYSEKDFDNMPLLLANWENNFKKDNLFLYSNLRANYTAPMLLLYKRYLETGEKEKAAKVKEQALKLTTGEQRRKAEELFKSKEKAG